MEDKKNVKRISLYFNLEDPRDLEAWNIIEKQSKRGAYIKTIICNSNKTNKGIVLEDTSATDILKEDIEDIEGIDF